MVLQVMPFTHKFSNRCATLELGMGIFSFFKKSKKDKSSLEPESKWKVEFIGTTIKITMELKVQ